MIHATISEHVNAPADDVRALYEDPGNWPSVFAGTIRSARVVRREADVVVVDVDHIEGHITNVLRRVSPTEIELREFKRRYDAIFVNGFVPEGSGTRYTLSASLRIKWPHALAQPILKPLVLARMRRHVVEPLKRAAERRWRPAS
jgi:hypothetical protein